MGRLFAIVVARAERVAFIAAVAAAMGSLSGCISLRLEAGEHDVKVVRHVGLLHVELASPDRAVIGQVSGLGLVATPLGLVIGHARQRFAAIGPECRAVLWIDDASALDDAARSQIQKLAGVCLLEARPAPSP